MGGDGEDSAEISGIVSHRTFVINGLICCLKSNTAREWLTSGVLSLARRNATNLPGIARILWSILCAPISMPLSWEALSRTIAGDQFIGNFEKYLKADPWTEMGKVWQKLPE